jgi:hypothetical protein
MIVKTLAQLATAEPGDNLPTVAFRCVVCSQKVVLWYIAVFGGAVICIAGKRWPRYIAEFHRCSYLQPLYARRVLNKTPCYS